jgi:hypothetical protein
VDTEKAAAYCVSSAAAIAGVSMSLISIPDVKCK